jgi:hypothetical protein
VRSVMSSATLDGKTNCKGRRDLRVAANPREGATEGNFSRESHGKSKSHISADLFVCLL